MREKTVRKTVRFSPQEAEKLELIAKAKGVSISELIRSAVLKLPIPERITPEKLARRSKIFRDYLFEINRIGININQIAKHCNQSREVDILVLERLINMEKELKELLNIIYLELTGDNRQASRKKQY